MLLVNRNFGLDLLRAIAVMLVVISHTGILPQYIFGLRMGQMGVEFFFVLSGFLIGQILLKTFTRELNFKSILDFWMRRWLRTIPVYYLVIIVKFLFIDNSWGSKIWVYFFFLQNNIYGIDFLGVSWSLVIEEWFYLFLPISLLLFFRSSKNITANRITIYLTGLIFFFLFVRLFAVLAYNKGYDSINGQVPFRLDSLLFGVLLANLKLNAKVYLYLSSKYCFLIAAFFYVVLMYFYGKVNIIDNNVNNFVWTRTIWFSFQSLLITLMLPFIESKLFAKHNGNNLGVIKSIVVFVSLTSYSLYLIHVEFMYYFISAPVFTSKWLLQSSISISISLVLSYILYKTVELPFMKLRNKIKI